MAEYRSKYRGEEVDALLDKIAEGNIGDIDSALSLESENPVMNKVITEKLNKLTETVGEAKALKDRVAELENIISQITTKE